MTRFVDWRHTYRTVKDLVEYWKTDFNWRKVEEDLNTKLPQFTSSVDTGEPTHGSIKLHFALRRSSRPNAIPLLFVHGWPGNFAEVRGTSMHKP